MYQWPNSFDRCVVGVSVKIHRNHKKLCTENIKPKTGSNFWLHHKHCSVLKMKGVGYLIISSLEMRPGFLTKKKLSSKTTKSAVVLLTVSNHKPWTF